jgi:hypothetical protein
MSIKSVVNAAIGFDKSLARTAVESAIAFGTECWNSLPFDADGGLPSECMAEILTGIEAESSWKGTASAKARRSEWKSAIAAVPFYFVEACRYFKATQPVGFTRVAMFKLARKLINSDDYKATVDEIISGVKKRQNSDKYQRVPTVAGVLKALMNVQTRKQNEIKFRREVAALAAKYGLATG